MFGKSLFEFGSLSNTLPSTLIITLVTSLSLVRVNTIASIIFSSTNALTPNSSLEKSTVHTLSLTSIDKTFVFAGISPLKFLILFSSLLVILSNLHLNLSINVSAFISCNTSLT